MLLFPTPASPIITTLAEGIFLSLFILVLNYHNSMMSPHYQIMSLFSIKPNEPICLKPSPPAYTHQLTQHEMHKNRIREEFENNKIVDLLTEIKKLKQQNKDKDQFQIDEKQKLMKQVLLLSVQIQHQREIINRYDVELKKLQAGQEDIHSIYELKLQKLKRELAEEFQREVKIEKERTFQELAHIRENYQSKLAIAVENHKQREYQLQVETQTTKNLKVKYQILQNKVMSKDRAIEEKNRQIAEYQEKYQRISEEKKILEKQFQFEKEQFEKKLQFEKKKVSDAQEIEAKIYEEYHCVLEIHRKCEDDMRKLNEDKESLKEEIEIILRKQKKLQKEKEEAERKLGAYLSNKKQVHNSPPQHMDEDIDEFFNSKETKRGGGSEDTENYKGTMSMANENEIIHGKFKELKEYEQKLKENEENFNKIYKQNDYLQRQNIELKSQLDHTLEQYLEKAQISRQRIIGLERRWERKEQQLSKMRKQIESRYLGELQSLKKKNEELSETLAATNEMFEQQIKKLMAAK